jgi:hypothetical protein
MEGSLVAYKVFTNGSVLNASEINDNLMNQSVMVFSNSTARAAALTAPLEGMLTWLQDVNRYESYNGSAWVALGVSGLEFITSQTFNGAASASFGSDASPIFSSTYDNYRIIINYNSSTDAERTISLRLRANTTDLSSASYRIMNQGFTAGNTSINNFATTATSSIISPEAFYSGQLNPIVLDLFYPSTSNGAKFLSGSNVASTGAANYGSRIASLISSSTSFNGFTLLNSSGNFVNSTVAVYGYRKA